MSGEDGSGKTTLVAKLQGADHNKKGRGLEYLYLNVHDEDRDGEFTCCSFSVITAVAIFVNLYLTTTLFFLYRPYPLQRVDPGWRPIPQRPA